MTNDAYTDKGVMGATFLFEVDGVEIGRFTEVSGLQVDVASEDVEEGGQNSFVHKLPGRMTWPNITLKRGVTQSDALINWLNKASGEQFASQGSKLERASAAITLLDAAGNRLRAWDFDGAFPVKWTGPTFAAGSTDMAMEEIEITHHGFRSRDV